jgi:hypothetical protein
MMTPCNSPDVLIFHGSLRLSARAVNVLGQCLSASSAVKAPRNAYRQLSEGERFGSEILHRQVKTSPASVAGLASLVNFRNSFHRYRRFSEQSGIIGRHT